MLAGWLVMVKNMMDAVVGQEATCRSIAKSADENEVLGAIRTQRFTG
jgi:hypothetical protein